MQHPSPQLAGGHAGGHPGEKIPPQVQPAVTMTVGTNSLTSEYWIRMTPPFFGSLTTPNRYFAPRGDPHYFRNVSAPAVAKPWRTASTRVSMRLQLAWSALLAASTIRRSGNDSRAS
jgi:hypothetical protein